MDQISLGTTSIEPVLWSSGTPTTEPTHCNYGSLHTLGPVLPHRRCSCTATREEPPLAATREKPTQQQRPGTAKNNKQKSCLPSQIYLLCWECQPQTLEIQSSDKRMERNSPRSQHCWADACAAQGCHRGPGPLPSLPCIFPQAGLRSVISRPPVLQEEGAGSRRWQG